ncbi:NADH-quinone oxidoreductase subunit I 2-like [Onychostruthus taczanowskii]|uniref:NADH-quinone oxidoreductase subunit I 2-like n=1 Tax=Onychostruthus taczanowskii TaxID=356909 RepID=UPI001B808FE7|nr:NADH-quinone oxidoreductase subunit I 2-like [Onychostruthus taczanowskii]
MLHGSPTTLGAIFLWPVPPHPPRCVGAHAAGRAGLPAGLRPALRRPPSSASCVAARRAYGPRDPTLLPLPAAPGAPARSCARREAVPAAPSWRCWRLLPGDRRRSGRRAPLDRSRPRGRSSTARARHPWAALMHYS